MSETVQESDDEGSQNEYIPGSVGRLISTFRLIANPRSWLSLVGGAKEIGRSCYQVETRNGTYLVDVGLNQGDGGLFPDLRGPSMRTDRRSFLTHAHIDHVGSLPLLRVTAFSLIRHQ